jgi:hypothetical protein
VDGSFSNGCTTVYLAGLRFGRVEDADALGFAFGLAFDFAVDVAFGLGLAFGFGFALGFAFAFGFVVEESDRRRRFLPALAPAPADPKGLVTLRSISRIRCTVCTAFGRSRPVLRESCSGNPVALSAASSSGWSPGRQQPGQALPADPRLKHPSVGCP